jgi:hypothetical protein
VGAFGATAAEAEKAAKKITDANNAIADTEKKITELRMGLLGDLTASKESYAKAYVDQEQKVSDLRKQLKDADDEDEKSRLEDEYNREKQALDNAKAIKSTFEAEVSEERRRNRLTDFEREVEDINKRNLLATLEYTKKLLALELELQANKEKALKIRGMETDTTAHIVAEVKTREDATVKSVDKLINKYNQLNSASGGSFKSGASAGYKTTTAMFGKSFAFGGLVPGAEGQAVPIIAHAGERVIPAAQSRGSKSGGGQSISISFPNLTVRSEDDYDYFRRQLDKIMRSIAQDNKVSFS